MADKDIRRLVEAIVDYLEWEKTPDNPHLRFRLRYVSDREADKPEIHQSLVVNIPKVCQISYW